MENAGTKFDKEKPRFDLLDPHFLEEFARVMTFGASKYAPHNWQKGLEVSRLLAASYRHLNAFHKGENNDPETKLSHLAHAACCLMFAWWMVNFKPEFDDRVYRQDYDLNTVNFNATIEPMVQLDLFG